MAESKMKKVAEILGVEMKVPFEVLNMRGEPIAYNPFMVNEYGLYDRDKDLCPEVLTALLVGAYTRKTILNGAEKKYLENVIRPFKDIVISVRKTGFTDVSRILISHHEIGVYNNENAIVLPSFPKNTMYKGMKANKEYTLEELGLFQD